MKNTAGQNNFEEKAIRNSPGLLKAEEKEAFRLLTDESSEDEKVLIKEYVNLSSLFSKILMFRNKELSPSSKVRDPQRPTLTGSLICLLKMNHQVPTVI